jgi:cysteine desulfurase
MTVNNETGAQYEVKQAFALAKRKVPQVVTHTDAVQGFLKTDLSFHKIGADLVTVSGHKIGATKGIGGLLVSNRILKAGRLAPLIFGGGQEGGLRSGTENVPGILSFGAAARTGKAELPVFLSQMAHLREIFLSALPKEIAVNQPQGAFAPHIISIRLPKIKSETMLRFLSEAGICVSSGSACSSHGGHDSYVLRAFGLTEEEADCTLRISMGLENTEKELLLTAQKLEEGLHILARRS